MNYVIQEHHPLEKGITYHRPIPETFAHLDMDSPAMEVMTDLKVISAITIGGREPIEHAEKKMIQRGIRLLLVVDIEDVIQGIITATDILGEKPVQYIQENGGTHREVLVRDIMVAREKIEVLQIRDVSKARVGDIVSTLKDSSRQHALVVDHQGVNNERTIRGIFSLTTIARRLGIKIRNFEVAHTLSEIAHHTRV